MRNLKKILALVLALVMTMSVMATAAFTDAATIDTSYDEAAEVLAGLKVFVGRTDGSFDPKASITRAEVAAIIYRMVTGDVKNASVNLYTEGADFTDTKGHWAEGYIGYCNNAGFIAGYGNGKFGPNDNVTGMQAAAMILRAIGYDAQDEFTGATWDKYVAKYAQENGLFKNLKADVNLNKAVSREVVAEILFQAIQADMVQWTPAFEYQPTTVLGKDISLGEQTFGLNRQPATGSTTVDKWGRPGHFWYADKVSTTTAIATIKDDALATYTTAATECQIASDVALKTTKEYTLYTNGSVNASKYTVQATDTVQTLGAQGTQLEIYKDVIVVIDTFLAKVTAVAPATYDAAGHKKTDARIDLEVYDKATADTTDGNEIYLTNDKADYTYAKGDYVLVNSYTQNTVNNTTGNVTVKNIANTTGKADYAVITGLATAKTGTQSYVLYNAPYHIVDGTTYNDAKWFMLDQAKYDDDNAHTWYFDSYGNLIGATDIATQYTFGIVENIQWINPELATGYAKATIRDMAGNPEVKVVTHIDGKPLTYAGATENGNFGTGAISTTLQNNAAQCGQHLYRIETATNGTIKLQHVFTDTDKDGVKDTAEALNHIANAEINPFGTGAAAVSAITNGTATVYANSNTKFLVQTAVKNALGTVTGYTYTVVEGYLNMAKYSVNKATVDFVNTDGDSYVDLVYVTGTPDSAAAYYGLFYLNTNVGIEAYHNATNTAHSYYVVNGILDGVAGTYKVAANSTYYKTAVGTIAVADFAEMVGKLSVVKFEDGKITEIWNEVADDYDLYTKTGDRAAYKNLKVAYQAATTTAGTTTKSGDVLKLGAEFYNIAELTPVVGAWADDMSGKNVYVIYDTTKMIAGSYVAKAVYIVDKADESYNSGVTPPATGAWDPSITGYQVNTTLQKIFVEAPATTSLGAMADAWAATGAVLTKTVAGVTTVVASTDLETVTSAALNGVVLTINNTYGAWGVVIAK